MLEALYERVPGHIEGNALRTQFLQYHAAHPELARACDAGADDWRMHFHHLRALTEIGDFRDVLAHTARMTETAGPELAFHAAAFSGHAKLALAADHAGAVTRAAALERSTRWLDTGRLSARLRAAIRDREPLSMIRLGDGEARFLALEDPWARTIVSKHEARCMVSVIWRNWFGQAIETVDDAELTTLSALFTDTLASADILGVSPAQRLERDVFHRGYLAILEHAVDKVAAERPGLLMTHAFANIFLHRRSPFYAELLSGLDFLGCISPHPGLAARLAEHHGIATCQEYIVPGEARLQARGPVSMPHFPDRFKQIMADVRVPRPGAVFLVASGLLGKIYCHHIRGLGGIAIDVGSVVDAWMGYGTRPGLYTDLSAWILPR